MLPTISFATVYNSLRFLKDAGHIAEISFGSGESRFDAKTQRHDHALCTACGKLIDMDLQLPAEIVELAVQISNFKPESFELTLRRLCPECDKDKQRQKTQKYREAFILIFIPFLDDFVFPTTKNNKEIINLYDSDSNSIG